MKKLLFLLLVSQACFAQIQVKDSLDHVVYINSGVHRAMPKRDISTEYTDPYLTVRYKFETLFKISNNAVVTDPTSSSVVDLRNKIIAIVANSPGGGGIGAADAATFTNKTMAWGSNTFTGFPYVGTSGNETVSGNKTFSGITSVGGNLLPTTYNTLTLGSASLVWSTIYGNIYYGAIYGNATSTNPLLFRQGTTNSVGGFLGTTGNFYVQPSGATPTDIPSARLAVTSTTQGMLTPRLTQAQRDAISSPATSLLLYCTDCVATDGSTGVHQSWNGTTWKNHW
jgi:hypothetical protein